MFPLSALVVNCKGLERQALGGSAELSARFPDFLTLWIVWVVGVGYVKHVIDFRGGVFILVIVICAVFAHFPPFLACKFFGLFGGLREYVDDVAL